MNADIRSELEELCNTEPSAEYYPPLLETIQVCLKNAPPGFLVIYT